MENIESMEILNENNPLYNEKVKSINDKLNKLGENRFFLSNFDKYEKVIKLRIYHGKNVIRDVLSLGVLVEVVEPDYIRKKILEILRKGEKLDSLHRVKTYDK